MNEKKGSWAQILVTLAVLAVAVLLCETCLTGCGGRVGYDNPTEDSTEPQPTITPDAGTTPNADAQTANDSAPNVDAQVNADAQNTTDANPEAAVDNDAQATDAQPGTDAATSPDAAPVLPIVVSTALAATPGIVTPYAEYAFGSERITNPNDVAIPIMHITSGNKSAGGDETDFFTKSMSFSGDAMRCENEQNAMFCIAPHGSITVEHKGEMNVPYSSEAANGRWVGNPRSGQTPSLGVTSVTTPAPVTYTNTPVAMELRRTSVELNILTDPTNTLQTGRIILVPVAIHAHAAGPANWDALVFWVKKTDGVAIGDYRLFDYRQRVATDLNANITTELAADGVTLIVIAELPNEWFVAANDTSTVLLSADVTVQGTNQSVETTVRTDRMHWSDRSEQPHSQATIDWRYGTLQANDLPSLTLYN